MKQVININFHGQVVPIEVSAFELLKQYTDSLSRYFAAEEGKEEIINDIESRIAELFQERLKQGATCITDDDVNAIIKSMGRPEEFDAEEDNGPSAYNGGAKLAGGQQSQQNTGSGSTHKRLYRDENDKVIGGVCSGLANYFGLDPIIVRIIFVVIFGITFLAYIILWLVVPSSSSAEIGGPRKKLFRDPDDKIIAGICSGIGNYFGVNAWVPRALFLLPFLSFVFNWGHGMGFMDFPSFLRIGFSPGSLIVYIILWLVIPAAASTAEKLEMKGEKVDLNSIKNSVMEEMKGVQQKAEKIGKEAKTFAEEKGKVMSKEISSVTKRGSRSLGDIIVFLVKAFAYFIIGCVGFALVIALFALAIASIGIFPLKDFLLKDGWQNILAWGTLLFFIAVPVIGVITWIIRRLAKAKGSRKIIRFSFISLWIIGWVCFITLIAMISRDFKSVNDIVEYPVTLANPTVSRLEITGPDDIINKNNRNRWLTFSPFLNVTDEDTLLVNNVHFRIVKSSNDSFQVSIIKLANGNTRQAAKDLAFLIEYTPVQKDSVLQIPAGIAIDTKHKFRNQHVIITVSVPVGKKIKIDQSIWISNSGRIIVGFNDDEDWDGYWGNEERGWTTDVEYIMKPDGLYTLTDKPADEWKHAKENKGKTGSNEEEHENIKKTMDGNSNYRYNNTEPLNKQDSSKQKMQKEQQRFKDSLQKAKESIEKQLEKIGDNESVQEAMSGYQFQLYSPLVNI